jgi:hypothetical protein
MPKMLCVFQLKVVILCYVMCVIMTCIIILNAVVQCQSVVMLLDFMLSIIILIVM